MVWAALIMGFAGSLHCVGMCSPLVLAVNRIHPSAVLNRVVYNLGRILTYGMLGFLVGTFGRVVPLAGFQNIISIVLGVVLLLYAVLELPTVRVPGVTPLLHKANMMLKSLFGKFLQRKHYGSVFILGSLNGLLPCGLTMLALAFCLTLAGPLESFYYMVLFGAGTLPVMLGLTAVAGHFMGRFSISFRKLTTTLLFVSGCLLIARVFFFHVSHAIPVSHDVIDIILCR